MAGATVLIASVVTPVATASASSPASTRARIAAVESEISAAGAAVHRWTQAYADATVRAATLSQQLHTETKGMGALRAAVTDARSSLVTVALRSYTGVTGTPAAPSTATATADVVSTEYLAVASGDVANRLDALSLAEAQLATATRAVRADLAGVDQAMGQASAARGDALATATAEQGRLTGLQAELTSLERGRADATQGGPVQGGLVTATQGATASTSVTTPPTTTPRRVTTTTTVAAPTSTTTTTPTTAPSGGTSGGGSATSASTWLALRTCESGDDYQADTGNGYYGAYQFSQATWSGLGESGRPDLAPPATQDAAAARLQARGGWGEWPACAAALGLT